MISQLSWLQNYCLNELLKEVVDKNSLEEFYQMPRHTVIGHNILSTYNFKSKKIKIEALQHQAKPDGSGFRTG
jgi:response regulator RpfG family c-di-GMP phosphodiesterase